MKIKEIVSQHRRDFTADYECEYCGNVVRKGGYDDDNFHRNVIPGMVCDECGESSPPGSYRPMGTKYASEEVV